MMRPYEVMIILEPGLDDEAVRALVERFSQTISAHGATVGRVDHWGRRRLAYEIRHNREGYYILIEAGGPPGALGELDRLLLLTDEVLRHKVIRVPDRVAGRAGRTGGAGEIAADVAAGGS